MRQSCDFARFRTMQISPFIRYIRDVLGLRQIQVPADMQEVIPKTTDKSLAVFVSYKKKEEEEPLFQKMVTAFGLEGVRVKKHIVNSLDIESLSLSLADLDPAAIVFVFGEAGNKTLRGEWSQIGQHQMMWTHSPAEALKDPKLKSVIWNDMKKVKRLMELH